MQNKLIIFDIDGTLTNTNGSDFTDPMLRQYLEQIALT